jgi:hypothetical protein
MRATCPAHLILLALITLAILGEYRYYIPDVHFLCSETYEDASEMLGDAPDPVTDKSGRRGSTRKNRKKKGKGQ